MDFYIRDMLCIVHWLLAYSGGVQWRYPTCHVGVLGILYDSLCVRERGFHFICHSGQALDITRRIHMFFMESCFAICRDYSTINVRLRLKWIFQIKVIFESEKQLIGITPPELFFC